MIETYFSRSSKAPAGKGAVLIIKYPDPDIPHHQVQEPSTDEIKNLGNQKNIASV
jgi:hypothetical protein